MESKESSPNEELDTNLEKEKEMVSVRISCSLEKYFVRCVMTIMKF